MCEKFDFVYQCVASTLHSKTKNGTYKYDITNNIFLYNCNEIFFVPYYFVISQFLMRYSMVNVEFLTALEILFDPFPLAAKYC